MADQKLQTFLQFSKKEKRKFETLSSRGAAFIFDAEPLPANDK